MSLQVLRDVSADLQGSPFLTVMADETTDSSSQEQVTLILRQVTQKLEVHEEFLGLYHIPSIDAAMLTTAINNVLIRMNLPSEKLREQCYDGASAMSSSKCGVAKRICELEPRAVYTHCYGHALNMADGDTLKQSKLMKGALEMTWEITSTCLLFNFHHQFQHLSTFPISAPLIKYFPRRDGIFQKLNETLPAGSTPGIRVLCSTRYVRTC